MPKIGAAPPKELRLFKWGYNPTKKGALYLTKKGAQEILQRYQKDGRARTINLQHSGSNPHLSPEDQYAVGHFLLEIRPELITGGIFASPLQFIDEAASQIQQGKWPYFSPEVLAKENGVICEITAFALTDSPAMQNIEPINLSEHSMDNILPSETLVTKVKPLKDMYYSVSELLKSCQMAMDHYREGEIHQISQKMTMNLPEWLEEIGKMIEQEDPEGKTEMSEMESGEQNPVAISMSEKSNKIDSLLMQLCKEITGKEDIEEIKGSLRALKANNKVLSQKLQLSEKQEVILLVEKGMREKKISPVEKEQFLSLSKKELLSFLSEMQSVGVENVIELPSIASKKPSQLETEEQYKKDAEALMKKAFPSMKLI